MENSKQHPLDEYARKTIHYKVIQLLGKYGFTHSDYNELTQEMTIDLWERLPKFDPNKAARNTFVARVIERKIATIIRHRQQEKRDYRRESYSLNEEVSGENGELEQRVATTSQEADRRTGGHSRPASERQDLCRDLAEVFSGLPTGLQKVAGRLLSMTVSEVARELDMPRATFYGVYLAKLRERLEAGGITDYLS